MTQKQNFCEMMGEEFKFSFKNSRDNYTVFLYHNTLKMHFLIVFEDNLIVFSSKNKSFKTDFACQILAYLSKTKHDLPNRLIPVG